MNDTYKERVSEFGWEKMLVEIQEVPGLWLENIFRPKQTEHNPNPM